MPPAITTPGASLLDHPYQRILILGEPKVGKTTCAMKTCVKPVYVISCGDAQSLKPGAREIDASQWAFAAVNAYDRAVLSQMDQALIEAARGVKDGSYKTIIWDDIQAYQRTLEAIFLGLGEEKQADGRSAWRIVRDKMTAVMRRLSALPCHVIYLCHVVETKNDAGRRTGIVPSLSGAFGKEIRGMVDDIVFQEKEADDSRVFRCSIQGVTGPDCRNMKGVSTIPADIGVLWEKKT